MEIKSGCGFVPCSPAYATLRPGFLAHPASGFRQKLNPLPCGASAKLLTISELLKFRDGLGCHFSYPCPWRCPGKMLTVDQLAMRADGRGFSFDSLRTR